MSFPNTWTHTQSLSRTHSCHNSQQKVSSSHQNEICGWFPHFLQESHTNETFYTTKYSCKSNISTFWICKKHLGLFYLILQLISCCFFQCLSQTHGKVTPFQKRKRKGKKSNGRSRGVLGQGGFGSERARFSFLLVRCAQFCNELITNFSELFNLLILEIIIWFLIRFSWKKWIVTSWFNVPACVIYIRYGWWWMCESLPSVRAPAPGSPPSSALFSGWRSAPRSLRWL